ncbi:MAG TPA: FAD-binding protein [Candidatus Limnocylindria bacterium]|nr:FAD-binding protein [Candidatus Limnocylindria bacterium]
MTEPSFLEKTVRHPLSEFIQLNPEQRANTVKTAFPDLHYFFDEDRAPGERDAPSRTRVLAASLHSALTTEAPDPAAAARGAVPGPALRERIVTDAFLRSEADRDQNVYLGRLFTRTLTHAVPDLIFLPINLAEAASALRWARAHRVPVTLRGAASTAMGGSVPNDAGLTLDLSRLDTVDIDTTDGVAVIGAGARLRTIHERLAERGLALKVYPSNLGGTLVGWFVTGGIGLNAFAHGRSLDSVRAADLLLPTGEHVRLHDDGRVDVPDGAKRHTLTGEQSAEWFRSRGQQPIGLSDLAGSEGVLGLVLQLTVEVERRPEIGAFLLGFGTQADALAAAAWIGHEASRSFPCPGNLKLLSASHLHHTHRVWQDEDARTWHERPSTISAGANLPWTRIAGPAELGVLVSEFGAPAVNHDLQSYLFVDFLSIAAARGFATLLVQCPGNPAVLGEESVRFARERFKPQQTKRLGPGLLAAEIVMPADEVSHYLPRAERLVRGAGSELDVEIYYLSDGSALVIGAYLTDHRKGSFAIDLLLAPALLDLATSGHHGKPYVLGRWQAGYFGRKFGREEGDRMRATRRALDPLELVNRGILTGFRFHGLLGAFAQAGFVPGIAAMRAACESPLSGLVRLARGMLASLAGPASGRGEPARIGARFAVRPVELTADGGAPPLAADGNGAAPTSQVAAARALNCVNCGECNSVCPIFHESKIRLPQMLTHLGEETFAGATMPRAGSVLLDLCMRCGKCEEVCQAGIPHLPLYEVMQQASDRERPRDRERHVAILSAVRGSPRYQRDFLHVRPGGYLKRTPASLPGLNRYLLLRAENDAGPAATCIHCGACVQVCPTHANHEYEGADPRWITTEQNRCIGCGTCVEVCPANHLNGGQTLRVMETPTPDWFVALEDFERTERS